MTFTPEHVRPLPGAPAHKAVKRGGCKRRKPAILTDTPVKIALMEKKYLQSKGKRANL